MLVEERLLVRVGNMITFKQHGDFKKTIRYLRKAKSISFSKYLEQCAEEGLAALKRATPVDTGKTAKSWGYRIINEVGSVKIEWTNSNIVDGVPIAIILQYGHATRNGRFIRGQDYINPAIKPIFDKISQTLWEELKKN